MLWLLLISAPFAAVDASDRWVGNDNLSVGIHSDGSFVNPTLELGILWDPDGAAGPIPMTGDLLRVGHHWDVWLWATNEDDDAHVHGGPHTDDWTALSWTHRIHNEALTAVRGELVTDAVSISMRTVVLKRQDILIQDIRFVAETDLATLDIGRTFDPNPDWWFTDSYSTVNDSGPGWASAASLWDDRAVGLAGGVLGGALGSGGVCRWCDSPADLSDSAGESGTGDDHPNVLVSTEALGAGEAMTVRFVYAFEIGAEAAADAALAGMDLADIDDDGLSSAEGDCNDFDPDVYPGATELLDGRDNDCDEEIDEDTLGSDDDGDGFSEAEGDCDDTDAAVFPGADPIHGVSNADCDGIEDTPPEDTGIPEEAEEDTGAPLEPEEVPDTGEEEGPGEGPGDDPDDPPEDEPTPGTDTPGIETNNEVHKGCSHTRAPTQDLWIVCLILMGWIRREERP
jgi:hypothetical protein